jgi:pyruvate kinase
MMQAKNKTKIVCTIGPASASPEVMLQLLNAGMNIARLNFSHGDFAWHGTAIDDLRHASAKAGKRLTIMADLPGPKIRIGQLTEEPIELKHGDSFVLTADDVPGDRRRVSVSFARLPEVVKAGDIIFLNDGIIQLRVVKVAGKNVDSIVLVGGELRSHKGLNLPGIDLGLCAFTERDRECLKFALESGVDAISQSFVETRADVDSVRQAAADMGRHPFIIAKIERAGALKRIDEILKSADGIMVARGDLGVETPLESIALVQKKLIERANLFGKPVITATQMLESMVDHYRPTRAESTDVANAILDGTDCVMLSEESAMGKYPVESTLMLAKIAAAIEPHRDPSRAQDDSLVEESAEVIIPTASGDSARMVARFKLPVWISAVSPDEATCAGLQFSYGVAPVHAPEAPK